MKLRLYSRSGVREYWLVDPEQESVKVLTLGPGCPSRADPGYLKVVSDICGLAPHAILGAGIVVTAKSRSCIMRNFSAR